MSFAKAEENRNNPDVNSANTVIAFVVEELSVGGAEQMLVAMANEFIARQWRVHMVCLRAAGELAAGLDESVTLHVLDKQPGFDKALPRKLNRCIRAINPVAVNSHLWVANTWTRIALCFTTIPVVITEHSRDNWKPTHYRIIDWLLARRTATLVSVSADTADFYRPITRLPEAKMTVINNGVDTQRYAAGDGAALRQQWLGDGSSQAVLLGTVGRLVTAKNHLRLLDAVALLLNDPSLSDYTIRLVIVGDGPERMKTEAHCESLGIQDVVVFAGARRDIPDVLAAFDVFVLSSDREGHPLTALEAQAAGTPVVLTRAGGSADAIAHGADTAGGMLVEKSAHDLAAALSDMIRLPTERVARGRFAQQYALAHFDKRHMVERYQRLFQSVGC